MCLTARCVELKCTFTEWKQWQSLCFIWEKNVWIRYPPINRFAVFCSNHWKVHTTKIKSQWVNIVQFLVPSLTLESDLCWPDPYRTSGNEANVLSITSKMSAFQCDIIPINKRISAMSWLEKVEKKPTVSLVRCCIFFFFLSSFFNLLFYDTCVLSLLYQEHFSQNQNPCSKSSADKWSAFVFNCLAPRHKGHSPGTKVEEEIEQHHCV